MLPLLRNAAKGLLYDLNLLTISCSIDPSVQMRSCSRMRRLRLLISVAVPDARIPSGSVYRGIIQLSMQWPGSKVSDHCALRVPRHEHGLVFARCHICRSGNRRSAVNKIRNGSRIPALSSVVDYGQRLDRSRGGGQHHGDSVGFRLTVSTVFSLPSDSRGPDQASGPDLEPLDQARGEVIRAGVPTAGDPSRWAHG
jgi:hypothetical protein